MKAIYQAKARLGDLEAILENLEAANMDMTDGPIVGLIQERAQLRAQIEAAAPSVEKTLAAIPDQYSRLVCTLRYRRAYTYEAIGKLLKQSSTAVRKRAARALSKLEEGAGKNGTADA